MKDLKCVLISLIFVVSGACSHTTDTHDDALPPPQVSDSDLSFNSATNPLPAAALVPQEADLAVAREERRNQPGTALTFFPGLQAHEAKGHSDELPFERNVAQRRKQIDLGLESVRQENKPVNNVIDWDF